MSDYVTLVANLCGLEMPQLHARTGHAEIYRARAISGPRAGEPHALKLVRAPRERLLRHKDLLDRIAREQAMASAPLPSAGPEGIVPVLAHGLITFPDDEFVYVDSPWIEGLSLEAVLLDAVISAHAGGLGTMGARLGLAAALAAAIASYQRLGGATPLVHRDLRPSNVILALGGEGPSLPFTVTAIDLDTACFALHAEPEAPRAHRAPAAADGAWSEGKAEPTPSAPLPGPATSAPAAPAPALACPTPGFAAPEDLLTLAPAALSSRTDVYALGVIAHQLMGLGMPYPFTPRRETAVEEYRAWFASGRAGEPSRALPTDVRAIIAACLEIDPRHRPSAREAADALAALALAHVDEPLLTPSSLPFTGSSSPTP